MKKISLMVIAMIAIVCVSCGSKTEKAEKEISSACVCDSCICDPCECTEQRDSALSESNDAVESVNEALDKSQTKASTGRGSCRHAGCGCQWYQRAEGGAGKCVCGHWDYVHN